jgi:hypothetical protein
MCEKSRPRIWKPALRCALGITISILGVACVTTEKTVTPPLRTHFVLEPGLVQPGHDSLPDLTPIYVRIYAGDQMVERRLAYKAWDFNRDGNIDMLEYLDAQGQVIRRSYDLNRDGVVDVDKR